MMRLTLVFILSCLAPAAWANTFVLTGSLEDGSARADGLFEFELAIVDATDTVLWTETQAGVIVLDGVFAIDVGAATPLPGGIPAPARLRVTIDDDVLPAFPLTALTRTTSAHIADRGSTSPTALELGGVTAQAAVQRSELLAAGGPSAPFAAVSGVPAGVADGDNGVDALPGLSLSLADRRLSVVNPVPGSLFADGAIDGSRFGGGTISDAKVAVGAVTGATAATSFTRANLTADPGEAHVAGRAVFADQPGCTKPSSLTIQSTCQAAPCAGGVVGCNGTGCSASNPTTCTNNRLGVLVAP